MSEQRRAADLLRQAADALTSPRPGTSTTVPVTTAVTAAATNMSAIRSIFAPYRPAPSSGRQSIGRKHKPEQVSSWSHRFCALRNRNKDTTPTREEKQQLFEAGLGERRITFPKDDVPDNFKTKIEEVFPAFRGCGGFELLRSGVNTRIQLEKLQMPSSGFTASYLANCSNLCQAVCYIRPIQRDLNEVKVDEDTADQITEECLSCGQQVPLAHLREHVSECSGVDSNDTIDETTCIPRPKKRKIQAPICQYSCIEQATDGQFGELYKDGLSIIEQTGFTKILTTETKEELLSAIKGHYMFYRVIGPLLQFIEGMKAFGVLKLLREHVTEAEKFFMQGTRSTQEDIIEFYKPEFSQEPAERELEEVLVYNFTKLLKRVGRGLVTSICLDAYGGDEQEEQEEVLTIGQLLQAFVGSTMLPTNISHGIIQFQHSSDNLSSVNTCVPSISLSQTKQLREYARFEECMKYIVVGSTGFGQI